MVNDQKNIILCVPSMLLIFSRSFSQYYIVIFFSMMHLHIIFLMRKDRESTQKQNWDEN